MDDDDDEDEPILNDWPLSPLKRPRSLQEQEVEDDVEAWRLARAGDEDAKARIGTVFDNCTSHSQVRFVAKGSRMRAAKYASIDRRVLFNSTDRKFGRKPGVGNRTKDELRIDLDGLIAQYMAGGGTIRAIPEGQIALPQRKPKFSNGE